jgi:hypothetical protein
MSYGGSNLFDALRAGKVVTIADGSKIKRWDPNVYMEDYLYGQATSHKHTVTISEQMTNSIITLHWVFQTASHN